MLLFTTMISVFLVRGHLCVLCAFALMTECYTLDNWAEVL